MKKLKNIFVLSIVFALFFSYTVKADGVVDDFNVLAGDVEVVDNFNVIAGDEVNSGSDVNGSSILAGNNVTSTNVVNGIDMVFGNNVNYKSTSDYALVAGNNVNVFGNIKNDGFIFGNLITFDTSVNAQRDLFVFGNAVTLNGKIGRDITIYAAEVTVNDVEILGNLTIYASTINVKSQAVVTGELAYNEDAIITIESQSIGSTKLLEASEEEVTFQEQLYSFLVDYSGMLVLFIVLSFIVPKFFKMIEDKFEKPTVTNVLSLLGYGALALIIVPIISVILLSFIFGMPLAMLLLAIYIIVICLSTIFSGYLYGYLIWKYLIKKENNTLLIGLIGITVAMVLALIPFIGGLISMINLFAGIGLFLQLFKKNQA